MPLARDSLDRPAIEKLQVDRLCALLKEILPDNAFYAGKLADSGTTHPPPPTPHHSPITLLAPLPFTTKAELLADQQAHPPYGTALTFPSARYSRMHQTSGTSGQPLRWLDTPETWNWLLECWEQLYRIAGVTAADRLFFAFSFGPFLGFWTAFEGANRLGYFCLPGGGMSSGARLRFLLDNEATVVLCTPTYALRLAEVARQEKIDLARSGVRTLIVAGEPGGSIPATRARIEEAWGARVLDHSGLTEVGAVAIECLQNPAGLHILESEYIAEVLEPGGSDPVLPGQVGELVLTNLGRVGSPLVRYRTGDLVRIDPRPCPCGRALIRLEGGILGRVDDMIHVRGNNLYPSAVEAVIRRFAEVVEFRVAVDRSGTLAALRVEIEPAAGANGTGLAERVDRAIRDELLFRAEVQAVPTGTLPRFEMKARRFIKS
jgi:phenylacetate-CoA ligase